MAETDFVTERDCGSFPKNARSVIRGRLLLIHDTPMADIRIFVGVAGTGEATPTKMGVCLARAKLPELAALVAKMIEACA